MTDQLIASLQAAGVDTRYVRCDPTRNSGVALILVDAQGENYINAVYGANDCCDERQVADARDAVKDATVLLVQQEIPLDITLKAMTGARKSGVAVVLDPAPMQSPLPPGFISSCDFLTPNAHEASQLCGFPVNGIDAARRAALQIRRAGPATVIVTLGQAGAWVEGENVSKLVPAPSVPVVATVGAGDAFNGGLAAGLVMGLDPLDAAQLGVAAGALCVTKAGAQEAMPTFAEKERLLTHE